MLRQFVVAFVIIRFHIEFAKAVSNSDKVAKTASSSGEVAKAASSSDKVAKAVSSSCEGASL